MNVEKNKKLILDGVHAVKKMSGVGNECCFGVLNILESIRVMYQLVLR